MNKKKLLVMSTKFLGFVLLFYVLAFANINSVLYPFAFGMMFALVWCDQKAYLVMPAYLIGVMAAEPTLNMLIISLCTVIVLLVPYVLHIRLRKNIRAWELGIYAVVSQIGYLYITLTNGGSPIYCAITVVLGILFMYCVMQVLSAVLIRGFSYRLTNLEIVYAGTVLLAVTAGFMHFEIAGFEFVKLFSVFLILVASYSTNFATTNLLAGVLGLGTVLASNNAVFFAPFILWALTASAFKVKNKYLSAIAVLIVEAVIGWYFGLYYSFGIIEFLPAIIATLVFVLVPNKVLNKVSALFMSGEGRLAMKNIVNRSREILSRRLGELSEVFNEMNIIFRSLVKKGLSEEEVHEMLYEELRDKICSGCIEKNKCHRSFADETHKVFSELVNVALVRGRVTLLDMPPFLTSRCSRLNALVSGINTLTVQYKKYNDMVGSIDKSKLLVADSLGGVSAVMKDLSKEIKRTVSFDTVREGKIMDELTYHNIVCADAIVYEKDEKTMAASLVVRSEDSKRMKIPELVSKVCSCKMAVAEVLQSGRSGFVNVNMRTAPRYDCIFGSATRAKSTSMQNGDSFSVQRLGEDKFMIALCDGMGSGEKAANASQTAIGLVENFYKAGFNSDLILSNVNKLLGMSSDDIFSALDICAVDLSFGTADMIKMGSPNGYLKSESGTKVLEGGALPLGIVADASPMIKKIVLEEGNIIVLCTDGISDSFGNDDELCDFLSELRSTNPQSIADDVLQHALSNSNGTAMDDMTVVALRIFERQ